MLAGGAATFDVMDQSDHRRVETLREYNDQAVVCAVLEPDRGFLFCFVPT